MIRRSDRIAKAYSAYWSNGRICVSHVQWYAGAYHSISAAKGMLDFLVLRCYSSDRSTDSHQSTGIHDLVSPLVVVILPQWFINVIIAFRPFCIFYARVIWMITHMYTTFLRCARSTFLSFYYIERQFCARLLPNHRIALLLLLSYIVYATWLF